jgi:hypothetical protein
MIPVVRRVMTQANSRDHEQAKITDDRKGTLTRTNPRDHGGLMITDILCGAGSGKAKITGVPCGAGSGSALRGAYGLPRSRTAP